jgi:ketose-bisphosphate aldolase
MPLTPFNELMDHAASEEYAVGYFECWNLESLLAVADAAVATRSPVLVGFSGIYLPHPDRIRTEPASIYAALGVELCRLLPVPAGLVFNESPHLDTVFQAINHGYGLVMFSREDNTLDEQIAAVQKVVSTAHEVGCAVEGEAIALPGVGGDLQEIPENPLLSHPDTASKFIDQTGVDAFAVNIGQLHLHGRRKVRLDMDLLSELNEALDIPLVLHGASSVHDDDIKQSIEYGIRKINVGSILKQTYFESMKAGISSTPTVYNPYEVIGSGLNNDLLMTSRIALQEKVEQLMILFGSAGKADLLV